MENIVKIMELITEAYSIYDTLNSEEQKIADMKIEELAA